MSYAVFVRRSIIFGTAVSASGIVLYSQLGNIVDLHVSLSVLNASATLSLSMTLLAGALDCILILLVAADRGPQQNKGE
jgi:hypothetical protein